MKKVTIIEHLAAKEGRRFMVEVDGQRVENVRSYSLVSNYKDVPRLEVRTLVLDRLTFEGDALVRVVEERGECLADEPHLTVEFLERMVHQPWLRAAMQRPGRRVRMILLDEEQRC
jgi:hypothetical protein